AEVILIVARKSLMCRSTFTSTLAFGGAVTDVVAARDGAVAAGRTADCAYAPPMRNVDVSNATTVFIMISARDGGLLRICANECHASFLTLDTLHARWVGSLRLLEVQYSIQMLYLITDG